MRTLLASALLASLVALADGCIGGGCSAYAGGGDQVYARGNDQLILCENGGFSATVGAGSVEGFYSEQAAGSTYAFVGTDGATGATAFDLQLASDGSGTATIAQFGTGEWQHVSLDQVSLDHADQLCRNLESRAWWTAAK